MNIDPYKHIRLFQDLDRAVLNYDESLHRRFNNHKGNVFFKINHLEVIFHRCKKSFERAKEDFLLQDTLDRRILAIDVESYIIFSNIVLDNLIWMLGPLIKGNFTKNKPTYQSFGAFCDWIEKNHQDVKDLDFLNFMLEFKKWFEKNIRNPRNALIIHKYQSYTQDTFTENGIKRERRNASKNRTEPPEEVFLFEYPIHLHRKLLEYIYEIEQFFVEKLI